MTRLRALFAASALLLAACPVAGMHVPSVDFALSISPAAAVPGDTITMVATLENPGADTLRMSFDPGCVVDFYVRSEPDGRIVEPLLDFECTATPEITVLPPGTRREVTHHWIPSDTMPRTYIAYAVLNEHHLLRNDGARDFKGGHRSSEIAIQIRPR